MQADPASPGGQFTKGLLNPSANVPKSVRGLSARRFGVYRNNVTIGLMRAMEANFPVVQRLLGAAYFEGFVREFVQKHPPSSPLMFAYGEHFAAYLEAAGDLDAYPYLGDMARLEQQIRLSHHEADEPCLSASALADVPESELADAIFVPRAATAILTSPHAIHAIYMANRTAVTGFVDNVSEAQAVLVTRPQFDVELNLLNETQLIFLNVLLSGQSFGNAADAAFIADERFDLSAAISMLLSSGAFQSISVRKTEL